MTIESKTVKEVERLAVMGLKAQNPEQQAFAETTKAHAEQLAKLEQTLATVQEDNMIDEDRSFLWQYKWWLLGAASIVAGAADGGG